MHERLGLAPRVLVAAGFGVLLNPLNASMMSVALVTLQRQFDIGVATSTWLQSVYYLSAAVGQPVMGRLVDLHHPRRVFVGGLVLVLAASLAAAFSPGFGWLVVARSVQGFGSSVGFPAALVLVRAAAPATRPPTGALAILSMTTLAVAALAPAMGGAIIDVAGWRAMFWISATAAALGIVTVLAQPPGPRQPRRPARVVLAALDLPGATLFATVVICLLMTLLSMVRNPQWWLVAAGAAALVLLVRRERAVAAPFLDVRGLAGNRALTSVLVQQGILNTIFYACAFGLPIWLDAVRGFTTSTVGLVMLPLNVVALVVIPLTARVLQRRGPAPSIVAGSLFLLAGSIGLQAVSHHASLVLPLAIGTLIGTGDGLNFLALQTALYAATPPERTGGSGGLFQTFRYLGAIMAASLIGIIFDGDPSSAGLRRVGVVLSAVAGVLVVLAVLHPVRTRDAPPSTVKDNPDVDAHRRSTDGNPAVAGDVE